MKERPILFSGPMVRAILENRKTQTRRILKPQPVRIYDLSTRREQKRGDLFLAPDSFPTTDVCGLVFARAENEGTTHCMGMAQFCANHCPHGQVKDRLWVKETFSDPGGSLHYSADVWDDHSEVDLWTPSLFMPRRASRITLEITDVRVERLQTISGQDCVAEGIDLEKHKCGCEFCSHTSELCPATQSSLILDYAALWDSINGKKHPWEENCWVWVITFKRV